MIRQILVKQEESDKRDATKSAVEGENWLAYKSKVLTHFDCIVLDYFVDVLESEDQCEVQVQGSRGIYSRFVQ